MSGIPQSLNELIAEFSKLPGIGKKTAERLAVYLLQSSELEAVEFSKSILNVKKNISIDDISHCFQENGECINSLNHRDSHILCIVKDPTEVFVIEKSGYNGHYHVLDGLISPLKGIGPENLNFDNLISVINNYKEIIIAFDPTPEGDATTLYIIDLLKEYDVKITRLARGIPVGSSFDYIDEVTLTHSLEDRVEIK